MYKFILYIFLFFAGDANSHGTIEGVKSTILGAVDPLRRCGGLATQRQLRISGCDGYCRFTPGQIYNCENDFMPSKTWFVNLANFNVFLIQKILYTCKTEFFTNLRRCLEKIYRFS